MRETLAVYFYSGFAEGRYSELSKEPQGAKDNFISHSKYMSLGLVKTQMVVG